MPRCSIPESQCRTSRRRRPLAIGALSFALLLPSVPALSQDVPEPARSPEPARDVVAEDVPNDGGGALRMRWRLSPDDARADVLTGYRILRSEPDGSFLEIATRPAGTSSYVDTGVADGGDRTYRIVAVGPGGESPPAESPPAKSSAQWFNAERMNVLLLMVLVCGAILTYIQKATSGEDLYIRKIAGMDAVTEAVGRATEMGQPVLYIAGIQDMDNVQTLAGLTILGSIAEMIAEYETSLVMPTSRSLVMTTARETVKQAYLAAGRPDAYRDDSIYYVTDEQFGFVAHVDGLMLRKKPATCFYLGAFFAESLILAETGNSIGAIQVAGTAMPTQLPFFVAACDYTLIGEELFAASAYLSQDEKMLGSLKGQDMGKLLAMVTIVFGSVVATFAQVSPTGPAHAILGFLNWMFTGAAAGGH
jgi:hypothetical protein